MRNTDRSSGANPGRHGMAAIAIVSALVACGPLRAATAAPIAAIGIENEYADVISQIGGTEVNATSIISDPNTDPHSFEANPQIAKRIGSVALIVKNGLGYDAWVDKIIAATANPDRKLIDVQTVMGLPKSTPNPHLWFDPKVMPLVAKAIADDLTALRPAKAAYFKANLEKFDASLKPWVQAIADFKSAHPQTPVAVTEPVADYMLEAAGCAIETPYSLQAAIMNGTDPAPQDVTKQNALFTGHKVKVFVYNQQVTDALTQAFQGLAEKNGVPLVGVYETMPTPGFTYQSWMMAEMNALTKAVTQGVSTGSLIGNDHK